MNTALVTGANKGIGLAIAETLGRRGFHVLIGARDEQRGMDAVTALRTQGTVADFVLIDMSELSSVRAAAEFVQREFAGLDLLINNAGTPGYPMRAPGWQFEAEQLERIWRTNFLGPFELIKQLMSTLANNHGKIVNVSIPSDPSPWFNCFAYQTTKTPLNVLTISFGWSFAAEGIPIEILAVTPGGTSTDLNGHIEGPQVKTPQQAADVILGFAFDDQNHNAQVINYDGTVHGG